MNPDQLREAIEYLDAVMREMLYDADGNVRALEPDDQARFDEGFGLREQYAAQLSAHLRVEASTVIPERRDDPIRRVDLSAVARDPGATEMQLRDGVLASLDGRVEDPDNMAHVQRVLNRHLLPIDGQLVGRETREWARNLMLRSTPVYTRAWAKYITGRHIEMTEEERAALQVGSNTAGGYLLPTHLDPTIILTNAGTSNVIRGMSRVVTLTEGTVWNGVTSAGVTASWDGEIVEVSDDSPTFARKSVATNIAQAFVQASIAATEDIAGLASDVLMMFGDARDRLEGAAHAVGTGVAPVPMGVFTAVHAVTASRVVSTTAATIGLVDIHATYRLVPIRWRPRGTWLANPLYTTAVKALGTAVSASYSGDLRDPVSTRWLDKAVVESDDAPTTQTTTALDDEILFGDFSQYLIVDKPGGMSVEYIPHLFNTANNLPDGRRGWFAYWRTGADVLVTSAFALLVDKTSA